MTANRTLARRIVWNTRIDDDTPAPDARELLAMCGLLEPGSHEITEAEPGRPHLAPHRTAIPPSEPRPARMTTPPGLRDLPPPTRAKPRKPIPMTAIDVEPTADQTEAPSAYIAAVHADEMFVDPTYQRPLDKGRARRMADAFDPTLVGVIDVSDRGPAHRPRYAVINGQHRRAALVLAHPDGGHAPMVCTVHRGLDVTAEARLFHELDVTTKRLNSWDLWHARRGAGDPKVTQIDQLCEALNLKAQPGQSPGNVGCVGSLEKLLDLGGPGLLTSTLTVLLAAYGRDWNGYYAPLVYGVGQLLHYYGDDVEPERLIEALGRSTPQQLRAQAAGLRELMPGSVPRLVAQVLVNRMNGTRGGRKLRDVRDRMPAGAAPGKGSA